mmetsp:Transcript_6587/g.11454  ORF Transcript_6587/g.11454 Transcript_6587/m.11454 type:complete len:278 (-) Transcript_6587:79-912(-)
MPELPEVETVVRALKNPLKNRKIVAFSTDWEKALKTHANLKSFSKAIVGQKIKSVSRRAKYIVITLSAQTLLVHLRMSGHLFVTKRSLEVCKYTHGVFQLDNGDDLRFRDVRKFGTLHLVDNPAQLFANLGPEPLEKSFTPAVLRKILHSKSKHVKPLLLDQSMIAGLGNIYCDEALHDSKIHPQAISDTLSTKQIFALHKSIQKVLNKGIKNEGASIDTYRKPSGEKGDMQNYVAAYGRTGLPCFTCSTKIKKMVVAQRGTHVCLSCQTKGHGADN